jgi:hypothetical protein
MEVKTKGYCDLDNMVSHGVSCGQFKHFHGFSTLTLNNLTLFFLPPNVTSVVQSLN